MGKKLSREEIAERIRSKYGDIIDQSLQGKTMHKVGIIGLGFVGSAVETGLQAIADIRCYDKFKESESLKDVVDNSDVLFVCVPTPMEESGHCDTSIVESACYEVAKVANERKAIVIKSTVPPGTTQKISWRLGGQHSVMFNPEFLTEKNFINDFLEQDRILIGCAKECDSRDVKKVLDLYSDFIKTQKTPAFLGELSCAESAEMVKYVTNSFLATKVAFFNEMYDVCQALKLDFEEVRSVVLWDKRIGKTHTQVPGPDGYRGFGGKCLVPETTVSTLQKGITTLSEVVVGDDIFDGKKYVKVTAKAERIVPSYVKIQCRGRTLEGSKDHIHLIDEGGKLIEKELKDLKVGDKCFIPRPFLPKHRPEYFLGEKPSKKIKWWKEVFSWNSPSFSRLVGLYLAEGCSGKYKRKNRKNSYSHNVIWSFGEHEKYLADEVSSTLAFMGLKSSQKLQVTQGAFGLSKCWIVRCRSVGLKKVFDKIGLGTNAGNKSCPIIPDDLAKDVIGAWLDGNGNICNGSIRGYSKSKRLINDLDYLLLGLGICSVKSHDGHSLTICQRKDVEKVSTWTKRLKINPETYKTDNYYKSPKLEFKEIGWLAPIVSVEILNEHRTVIAIETESEKYVANNILTHNCLPKDTAAILALSKDKHVDSMVVEAAFTKNLLIREKYDWEEIPGATTEFLHGDD